MIKVKAKFKVKVIEGEVLVSDDVVISKPKRGRPRKSGRALEVDDVVESVTDHQDHHKD